MQSIFDGKAVFDHPKPIELISQLIQMTGCEAGDIVLDFFAGSSTTAHSVLEESRKGEPLKFIMIQLPEIIDPDNDENQNALEFCANNNINPLISELSKERIRRVISKINNETAQNAADTPLFQYDQQQYNPGFKVFKYDRSNFKYWNLTSGESVDTLTPLFDNFQDPLIKGWKRGNLINELLLFEGFPLTSKLLCLDEFLQNQVYKVSAPDFCDHNLFVCLDKSIHPSTVELLRMEDEDIFVCLDNALSDELKARVQDQFNVHVI